MYIILGFIYLIVLSSILYKSIIRLKNNVLKKRNKNKEKVELKIAPDFDFETILVPDELFYIRK